MTKEREDISELKREV
jgi:predicted metal-dependent hydrolase